MMYLLFAITDPFQKLPGAADAEKASLVSPVLRDFLVIIIALLLVVIAVLLWAIYMRKPKKIVTEPLPEVQAALAKHPEYNPKKKRFRRRRAEEFTHRNPTLAELGGLPPVKQDQATIPESQ